MPRRRLIWKLYAALIAVVALSFAGMFVPARWEVLPLGLAMIAGIVGLVYTRQLARPLSRLLRITERFARGDFTHKIPVPDSHELGALAESLNRMAGQLDEKIRAVTQQTHEVGAILSSMTEGVLAVDLEERVISLNDAAASIMGVEPARVVGRPIQEIVRNSDLQQFIARTLASNQPVEDDIVLSRDDRERFLQLNGAALRDAGGRNIGALVVFNDVTRLRRLENMRRDFVANVSHELKTPITSIKGYAETLRDGAMDEPENRQRFLDILMRQADRLMAIIEDLLRLSRIEQDEERGQIELELRPIRGVLQAAINDCQSLAAEAGISVVLACPDSLEARVNSQLIEQAVFNLLENAVKYSPRGSMVELTATHEDGQVAIDVRDQGAGIAAEHLPHLFQRFYRVDKGRSRKAGGTGLGLAIVKHIAQAHRGSASVDSAPGRGSTFTIRIPLT